MIRRAVAAILVAFVAFGARAQSPGAATVAVEYFHAGFGHYFVTAQANEIAGIDAGVFAGFARTGESWGVWTSGTGLADVCRFFTTFFAPKSSHFYTANGAECDLVKQNPVWQYEKLAFQVVLPGAGGACPVGVPLYRLYNNGTTGAPNHRYTTSLAIRAQMLAQGYTAEADNTICVAPAGGTARTTAEGFWIGTTNTGRTLIVVVLDDGYFAAIYTPPGQPFVFAGAVQGSSTSANGTFTSVDGKDFSFAAHAVAPGSVTGTYVPTNTIQGTLEGIAGARVVHDQLPRDLRPAGEPRGARGLVRRLDVVGGRSARRVVDDLGRGRHRRRDGGRLRVHGNRSAARHRQPVQRRHHFRRWRVRDPGDVDADADRVLRAHAQARGDRRAERRSDRLRALRRREALMPTQRRRYSCRSASIGASLAALRAG